MHLERLKYFQKLYPADNCISGTITKSIRLFDPGTIMVGTPCIAVIQPFSIGVGHWAGRISASPKYIPREIVEVEVDEVADNSNDEAHHVGIDAAVDPPRMGDAPLEQQPQPRVSYDDIGRRPAKQIKAQNPTSKMKNPTSKIKTTTISDLSDKDPHEIDNILSRNISKIKVFLPFYIGTPLNDYCEKIVGTDAFACSRIVPIIHDKGSHTSLERLSDVHDKDEISNFGMAIGDVLKSVRYVNYTFTGIAKSNIKYIMEDINRMYNALRSVYEIDVCTYMYAGNRSRMLIDTVSISFYNLCDMIPIFDSKRAKGIGIEISLASSSLPGIEYMGQGGAITYRFIMACYRENILTIDGEKINRALDVGSNKAISCISKVLRTEAPNDMKLHKRKPAMIREDQLCAE